MRVLFVHTRMVGGGVERVTLTLIDEFQKRGLECCLALRHAYGHFIDEAFALTDVVELAPSGLHQFVPRLARQIREFAPTHIVTAMPDVTLLTLFARKLAAIDACIVQGVHVSQAQFAYEDTIRMWLRGKFERLVARIVYRNLDGVVAVSSGLKAELHETFGIAQQKVVLIHNPIVRETEIDAMRNLSSASTRKIRFVAIGRLSREKGFDVLVRALRELEGEWQLDIYGSGPELERLSTLVATCGLEERIVFCGHTDDPGNAIDASDWLVLPSRVEGFGVVLVEALARGIPVISSDCPHGPREILDNGKFGMLYCTDNVGALAAALRQAIEGRCQFDPNLLRQRALDFSVSRSIEKWLELLNADCR